MKKLKMSGRRILSLMVALMLIIGCLSMTAFATGESGAVSGAGIGGEIKGGLGEVYDIINTIALPLAALSFVYAALQFFLGGQQGVEKAKKTMIWTIIGIALVYLAPYLVTQIKGWFDGSGVSFNDL